MSYGWASDDEDNVAAGEWSCQDAAFSAHVMRETTSANTAFDQRRVAQAGQDVACPQEVALPPPMPQWPPTNGVERKPIPPPVAAAKRSRRSGSSSRSGAARAPRAPHATESVAARISRNLKGVAYDVKHWDHVAPPEGGNKVVYILTRDDRAPVTSGCAFASLLFFILFVVILVRLFRA